MAVGAGGGGSWARGVDHEGGACERRRARSPAPVGEHDGVPGGRPVEEGLGLLDGGEGEHHHQRPPGAMGEIPGLHIRPADPTLGSTPRPTPRMSRRREEIHETPGSGWAAGEPAYARTRSATWNARPSGVASTSTSSPSEASRASSRRFRDSGRKWARTSARTRSFRPSGGSVGARRGTHRDDPRRDQLDRAGPRSPSPSARDTIILEHPETETPRRSRP